MASLKKQMRSMNKDSVEVGHFSGGKHTDSPYSNVQLMALHNVGWGNRPARRVRAVLKHQNQRLTGIEYSTLMKAWGSSDLSVAANERLLEGYGKLLAQKEKDIFGKIGPDMPATESPKKVGVMGPNAPLVDTGELREAIRYRTSISKTEKKA